MGSRARGTRAREIDIAERHKDGVVHPGGRVWCARRDFTQQEVYFGSEASGSGTTMVIVLDQTVTVFTESNGYVSRVTVIVYMPVLLMS